MAKYPAGSDASRAMTPLNAARSISISDGPRLLTFLRTRAGTANAAERA